ncbi:hypothetical protein GCM10007385_38910 [Tateyamaria omphalii]|uniref:hypothetical protein n=1 Tax=Tateyamaria omphalii TaxID=299262 RepID=UPI0016792649|nr:hypothetical protein [Tateyamaria omphalii]GGX65948.1 hypothetical protein GCM10007385_38910 [Tateyamaria omphalii]
MAIPYQEPQVLLLVVEQDLSSALALRFLMLTVARAGEVRFVVACETVNDVWTLDPKRMKTAATVLQVPLSSVAQRVTDTGPTPGGAVFFFLLRQPVINCSAQRQFEKSWSTDHFAALKRPLTPVQEALIHPLRK